MDLKRRFPDPNLLTCAVISELPELDLGTQIPAHFCVLYNHVSDKIRYMFSTPSSLPSDHSSQPHSAPRNDINDPAVNLILMIGVFPFLLNSSDAPCRHAVCELRAGSSNSAASAEISTYQALFADYFAFHWDLETMRKDAAVSSPMPWSRASREELLAMQANPDHIAFEAPMISEDDLADDPSPHVTYVRTLFGCPVDIPWHGAPHDSYPFCSTLSGYTHVRRADAIHGFGDDAALWVSALSFGLLEAVMRVRIPESVLVVPGEREGEFVLSGARILRLLVGWYESMSAICPDTPPDSTWDDRGLSAVALLIRAVSALEEQWDGLAGMLNRAGFSRDEVTDTVYALMLTILPLSMIVRSLWLHLPEAGGLIGRHKDPTRPIFSMMMASYQRRLRRAHWCPYTVNGVQFSALSLPLLSNIPKSVLPYIRSSPDEHKDCNESSCVFYTITDTTAYLPRHVNPSCTCKYTKPPLEDVIQLLSEGVVPVIIYDKGQLHVRPSTAGPYVSLSHVWADGMGSTTDDGLPTCVVERVAGLARGLLPESGAFWLDSLCIPATGDMRKRAIKLMANTYRGAAKVLVIDQCIRAQCSARTLWTRNLLYIASSGWVRRVWTLQEGLLARELWFEFAEGPVNIDMKPGRRPGAANRPPDSKASAAVEGQATAQPQAGEYEGIVPILKYRDDHRDHAQGQDSSLTIGDIAKLLDNRTTTRAEDETLAVSTLLPPRVDIDTLLSVSGPNIAAERMKVLLLQIRELPIDIPMWFLPRLSIPCFSWAPQTLASTGSSGIGGLSDKTGICTDRGFLAEYFVAAFKKPVTVPEACRNGSERAFNIIFEHSNSTWTSVVAASNFPESRFAESLQAVDGMLFLSSAVAPSDNITPCAAVSGLLRARAECPGASGTEEDPLRLDFVSSVMMRPLRLASTGGGAASGGSRVSNSDNFGTRDILEEASRIWVLLR
ncbi:hypothetical protein C8Q79DRAFT_922032 [Trametes meyenii]|nr:hypothetical protein C8Q79DRAFT_922032 [Trametes meyenii]